MASSFSTIETAAAAEPARPAVGQLSFTGRRPDGGINLWNPAVVRDDWAEQCGLGHDYADEAVSYIRETHDAAMLPNLVRTIAERGTFSGVEVGFFAAISMALYALN